MKSLLVPAFVILALVSGAVPLSAHHSWPVNFSQLVTVKGTIKELRDHGFPWDAEHLHFTVREPFPSRTTQTGLVFGKITRKQPLRLISQMAGYGVIFSDGPL